MALVALAQWLDCSEQVHLPNFNLSIQVQGIGIDERDARREGRGTWIDWQGMRTT